MEVLPLALAPTYKPDQPRIARCRKLAQDQYPDIVATILIKELDVWAEFGYRLGGALLMNRLMAHLERRQTQPPLVGIVHRSEVE